MRKANYFTKKELEIFNSQSPIFSGAQMKIINRKTPDSEIEIKKDSKGFEYKSVKAAYMKALLMLVTGGNFSFEIKEQTFLGSAKEIKTTGSLTIFSNGKSFTREQNGKSECNIPEANAYKASASDCEKKCISEFGFCWDIYGQEHSEDKKEEQSELDHAGIKKLERLKHFMNESDTPEAVRHNYNTYLKSSPETEASKVILQERMHKLGFSEALD